MRYGRGLPIVALLVAGCLSASTPQTGPPTTSAPTSVTYPWGITECAFTIVSIPVPADRLASRLPANFRVGPSTFSRVPSEAALDLDVYDCKAGVGLNETLSGVDYGSFYTGVTPPDELREDGYGAYFVKWDFLVPDAARRNVFRAAGLPSHDGSADVTVTQGVVTASLELADAGGFRFTGTVGDLQPQAAPLPFMEYTPLAGPASLARWHARLHDARIGEGAGEVELVPGSWVADLAGSTRVPATAIAGVWNLDEADVTFPVPWPA